MRGADTRATFAWAITLVLMAATAAALFSFGAGTASAARVCNLSVNSENVADNAIQSAINSANPGWTICIGAGTFPEQLSIATSGITLAGASAATTILAPTNYTTNANDWDQTPAMPIDALVLVDNTTGVTIEDLTVSGATLQSTIPVDCGVGIVGVDFQNSSGTLTAANVSTIQNPSAALGCQEQLAVLAYTGYFGTGFVPGSPLAVQVSSTSVWAYGKNGITCNDPGVACTLSKNKVTGIGATPSIAQNGIQIGFSAQGVLVSDSVAANAYTGATATLDWYGNGYQSSGILFYLQAAGSSISKCTLTNDAMGIVVLSANNAKIIGNTVTSSGGYGIVANTEPGVQTLIANNTVTSTAASGIGVLVDNGTFNVSGNKLYHAQNTGPNGASQEVCGPGLFLSCATPVYISTAAIQAVSESGVGATSVTLFNNQFRFDAHSVTTVAVLGGAVSLDLN